MTQHDEADVILLKYIESYREKFERSTRAAPITSDGEGGKGDLLIISPI